MLILHFIIITRLFTGALLTTMSTEEPMVSVWVVSGGRVDLPCKPQPKLENDQPILVLWYRSSSTLPIYSFDARVGDFPSGVRWADEVAIGGRAYFAAAGNPPALVLEPAHAHDQGIYTCRVDYRVSTSTKVMVNLTVVVPPGPPVVIWEGREMVGTVGPLKEDELTELICRSVGGRPTPVLTWWNEGRQLPLLSTNSTSDAVTGSRAVEATLSVTAKRELQGGYLTCYAHTPTDGHVSKTATIQPRSASVSLNITLSPVEVRILESDSVVVTSGSTISVVCRALGSHPPAELSWWRGSRSLEPHVTHAIEDGGNITTATLSIVVTGEDDGAILSCNGANPALPYQPLTDSTRLIVYYEPVVSLALGRPLEPGSIKEGDDVYFECGIKANPHFHRIEWYHNGLEIIQNVTAGVVISVKSLVIRSLQRKYSGSYTCIATNVQGRTTSNTVHLIVRHAPICAGSSGMERTQGAARGTLATAKCSVEAEPTRDITWSWVRRRTDGSEEEIPQHAYTTDGLTSVISVTPQRREDYGRLLCRATNDVGRQKTPCVVNLVPAGPPDSPTNCSAAPINPEAQVPADDATLAVTCIEGFDGGLPQNFLLEAWQDGMVLANLTSEFPEWIVGGVRAGEGVKLNIVGHNARGRSDSVTMEVHTSSAQHRAAPDQDTVVEVQPLVGAVLGVVGVLFLLLLVGVVIARKAQTRPKKPTADKTIESASGEGFDPDVVQSSHRCPPSVDVIPSLQEQHSKDESDPMFSYSYRQERNEAQDSSIEGASAERILVGTHTQPQSQAYSCPSRHRLYNIDEQHGLRCASAQSDDSGVSESESDSELKHPDMGGHAPQALFQKEDGGRVYIAVPTMRVKSPQTSSSVEVSSTVESSSCGGDSGIQHPSSSADMSTRCSSSTENRDTPDGCRKHPVKSHEGSPLSEGQTLAQGLSRRSPPSTEMASPIGSPVEVICLVSPIKEGANQQPSKIIAKNVHRISIENLPQSETSEYHKGDQKMLNIDSSSIGLPVTLLKGSNGEIFLLPRRTSECEATREQSLPSPVYAITTLPKASGKRSRANLEKQVQGLDSSPIKKDAQKLPPVAPKNTGLDVKHVGRREYRPTPLPDVSRRESSV